MRMKLVQCTWSLRRLRAETAQRRNENEASTMYLESEKVEG